MFTRTHAMTLPSATHRVTYGVIGGLAGGGSVSPTVFPAVSISRSALLRWSIAGHAEAGLGFPVLVRVRV